MTRSLLAMMLTVVPLAFLPRMVWSQDGAIDAHRALGVTLEVGRGLSVGVCDVDPRGALRCTGTMSGPLGFRGSIADPGTGRHVVRGLERVHVVDVSLSERLGCVVDEGGAVWCWGSNRAGQLGSVPADPASAWSDVAVQIAGIATAVRVVASNDTACALMADGAVSCWGENRVGQLGNGGGEAIVATPTRVALPGPAIDLDLSTHACAVIEDGRLFCWGANQFGQLGLGSVSSATGGAPTFIATPSLVPAITDVVDVELSAGGTYTRHADGTARAWGHAHFGYLGPGVALDAEGRASPVASPRLIDGLAGVQVVGIALGGDGGPRCVLGADGHVRCWAAVRDETAGGWTTTVTEVAGIIDAVRMEAGGARACAVRGNGQVLCWGYNGHGELGGRETRITTPTRFFRVRVL